MRFSELIRLLKDDGWVVARSGKKHDLYTHPDKPGVLIPVSRHKTEDVKPGTLASIMKDAGLKKSLKSGLEKELKMKKYHYPAFFREEAKGFSVNFPDLPGCHTQGSDLEEAFEMAEDALTLYLYHLEETGISLPAASDIKAIPEGTTVYVISADTLEYREIFDNTAVKKTLTIPSWMNKAAEKQGVNFSQLLQSAIKNQLSSHGDQ